MDEEYQLVDKIEGYQFPYLLSWIIRNTISGRLILRKDTRRKILYVSEGSLSYSASNEEKDSLGTLLITRGYISSKHLEEAVQWGKMRGKTLGRSLIELDYVNPEVLLKMVSLQLATNILKLFSWDRFLYILKKIELPSKIVKLNVNSYQMLFESVGHVRDEGWLDKLLGPLDVPLAMPKDFLSVYKKLYFNEEVDLALTKIDGQRTVRHIFPLLRLDRIRVKQILGGLKALGIIVESKE